MERKQAEEMLARLAALYPREPMPDERVRAYLTRLERLEYASVVEFVEGWVDRRTTMPLLADLMANCRRDQSKLPPAGAAEPPVLSLAVDATNTHRQWELAFVRETRTPVRPDWMLPIAQMRRAGLHVRDVPRLCAELRTANPAAVPTPAAVWDYVKVASRPRLRVVV